MATAYARRSEGQELRRGNIESDLALEFLRVVEKAAIASARTMGQGDRKLADQVATEAMRQTMDTIPMRGTIVIGEGERDEAPMLYIGEKVGAEFPDGTRGSRGRHRRRSAGRHQPLRDRSARRHHRAGRLGTRRPAQCARLLHGKNRRRPVLQRCGRSRRAGGRQSEEHRQAACSATSKTWWSSCSTARATRN